MPQVAQGDIFSFAESVDLLIVFGHRGFNEMDIAWGKFRERFPTLDAMGEPFRSFDAEPIEYAPGKFIVTVAEESNHGMSDDQLRGILKHYFEWAKKKKLRRVATNGIMDTNHSRDTTANRASDDRRAQLLMEEAKGHEDQFGLKVILPSLNDVFVRQKSAKPKRAGRNPTKTRPSGNETKMNEQEAKEIAGAIRAEFDIYLNKYDFRKYPAEDYATFKSEFSKLSKDNQYLNAALVWKWGHVGKKSFPNHHKNLIQKVQALWPDYIKDAKSQGVSAEKTFTWWSKKLSSTSYITTAYITHLVHHADPLPIIDQHNFRAMNHFLGRVGASHGTKLKPSSWADISQLQNFMTEVLRHLPEREYGDLDRFFMMYGKSIKPRKPKRLQR